MDESCPREFQLLTYSHNKFVDFIRNRNRIREHETTLSELDEDSDEGNSWEPVDPAPTPQLLLESIVFWMDVLDAVDNLSSRDRELFQLRWIKEKSVREIAKSMNLSENAMSQAFQRMEARLRKILVQSGVVEESQGCHKSPPPQAIISILFEEKSR